MAKINLGDRVKDQVTGFAGIAVCITEWLNGCARVGVQPETLDKDGKPQETQHFDDQQLTVIAPGVVSGGNRETGGPRPAPARAADPRP